MAIKPAYIFTVEELQHYLDGVGDSPIVFDTETAGLSIFAPIVCASLYDFKREPVTVFTDCFFDGIPIDDMVETLNEFFVDAKVIGHNIKYDLGLGKRNGLIDPHVEWDTAMMVHLYDPDAFKKLETVVKTVFKIHKPTYEEIIGKKWDKVNWAMDVAAGVITIDNLGYYAADDVYWTGKVYEHYLPLMTEEMANLWERVERPLLFTLRDMHDYGVEINVPKLVEAEKVFIQDRAHYEQEIYAEAGAVFNMNSPAQKAKILYEKMGLPCYKKTKSGGQSTDGKVLKRLADDGYNIAKNMTQYMEVQTLISRYTSAIPNLIDDDGRLRCSFNADGTRTGRLSSNEPNLQNIPARSKRGLLVRSAFVASIGTKLLNADLSQIEPRIMAHLSQDAKMLSIYHSAGDIYIGIAEELRITRDAAKIVQLAISYGLGAPNLASALKISKRDAEFIIANYYSIYRTFKRWKDGVEKQAERDGVVYNMFGRIRRLQNIHSRDAGLYHSALRQAVNTVIQGSAADLIKISMNATIESFRKKTPKTKLLLTVHDELLAEAPFNNVEESFALMIDAMQTSVKLSIPVIAEGKVIDSWEQMKNKTFTSLLDQYSFRPFPTYLYV